MEVASQFERWRQTTDPNCSWGLAWFLASEFCERFYSSHGLVPWVIDHDGLGYYGITVNQLSCKINPEESPALGRFTISGDVENWLTGSPGDHAAALTTACTNGLPTWELVAAAIRHLGLPIYPKNSHIACRHHRWGASYVLCFKIATCLALHYDSGELEIWNHPHHTRRLYLDIDPNWNMHEHSGLFLFRAGRMTVCIAGDGRMLDGSGDNVWTRYMAGESASCLATRIAGLLKLSKGANSSISHE